jgi:endonuclease/exonuclease/phosphatase family metal-dependent hydrolase
MSSAADSLHVLTWNLQGSRGVDTAAIAEVIGRVGADVVLLQEIQRAQAARLASAVTMPGHRWTFKHWTILRRAEGAAVLTRHRLVASDSFVLRRAPFWSWRRRVALEATIERDGSPFGVVDVHLSPHGDGERRRHEAQLILARVADAPHAPVIGGDLNELPGGPAHATFTAAGWTDAWQAANGDDELAGATNWTPGPRAGRPPTQRLDYVLVPPAWSVEACAVPIDASRRDDAAGLSDHLPVSATLRPSELGDVVA